MNKDCLSIQDITVTLSKLGINEGDTVMVHSAFSSLGAIEKDAEGFLIAIEEVIGPKGTIAMPVFNWDILHQGDEIIYDVKNTPSKMGHLTEYFRKREGTVVSHNLFNPLAVKGYLSDTIMKCPNQTSWGKDSSYQILYDNNAAILMIGVDYNVVTMFHVAESMSGVPYRFVYEFPNAFLVDESGNKNPIKKYNTEKT